MASTPDSRSATNTSGPSGVCSRSSRSCCPGLATSAVRTVASASMAMLLALPAPASRRAGARPRAPGISSVGSGGDPLQLQRRRLGAVQLEVAPRHRHRDLAHVVHDAVAAALRRRAAAADAPGEPRQQRRQVTGIAPGIGRGGVKQVDHVLRADAVPAADVLRVAILPAHGQAVAMADDRIPVDSVKIHVDSSLCETRRPDQATLYLKAPFLPAPTLICPILPPSAMLAKTVSAISGRSVPLRIWSTLRAPESTSVQRASTASTSAPSQPNAALWLAATRSRILPSLSSMICASTSSLIG